MPDLHFIDSSRTFEAGTNNGAFDVLLKSFCRLPETGDPCFLIPKKYLKGKMKSLRFLRVYVLGFIQKGNF